MPHGKESEITLRTAFAQLDALTRRPVYRYWAVVISGLAFFSAIGAYYVTSYLKFRSTVYDADALYLPTLYSDVAAGVSLAGWHTPTVPYVLPDGLEVFVLRTLISNIHVALAVFGVMQILLFTGGLLLLAKQLFEFFRLEHFVLILLAGSLFLASLPRLQGHTQMFAVSVYHFGVMVVMPYVFVLALAFWRLEPGRKRRWLYLAALTVLLALLVMSDLFGLVQIGVPLISAALLLWLLRKVRLKQALLVCGAATAAVAVGYGLIQIIPIFRESYTFYSGNTSYTVERSFADFSGVVQNLLQQYPLHFVLVLAFVACCAVIVLFEVVGFIRYRHTRSNFVVFLAAAFLIILMVDPPSVIVTTIFRTSAGSRYLLPLIILPAFWCWPHLLAFFASPAVLRTSAIVGLGLMVVMIVNNGLLISSQVSKVQLDDFYPEWVRCIDEFAAQHGVQNGLTGYWHAKPLSVLSKQQLQSVQILDNLAPYLWINNSSWYDIEPEFVVIDSRLKDINPQILQDRFGLPAAIGQCRDLEVWVYNRPADDLFRLQLKTSPHLARLQSAGGSIEFYAAQLPGLIGRQVGLFRVAEGEEPGFLTFGPYIDLPAGQYQFEIDYQIEGAPDNVADWDVSSNAQVVDSGRLPQIGKTYRHAFSLAAPSSIEVRTFYEGHGKLTVEKIRIFKIE
jgi:hypothetical protein